MHIYIHMNITYIYIGLLGLEGVYSIMYNSQYWMIPIGKYMQCNVAE